MQVVLKHYTKAENIRPSFNDYDCYKPFTADTSS